MSEFGDFLRELRLKNKLTQRELANKLGISFTYISKLETGYIETTPSKSLLSKMAKILKVDEEELFISANKIPQQVSDELLENKLAVRFLRSFKSLSKETLDAINREINNDRPSN